MFAWSAAVVGEAGPVVVWVRFGVVLGEEVLFVDVGEAAAGVD